MLLTLEQTLQEKTDLPIVMLFFRKTGILSSISRTLILICFSLKSYNKELSINENNIHIKI